MIELGVNIDHVATLREARKGSEPDLIAAAKVCEVAGAHQITAHLREDRRHIQDRDMELLRAVLQVRLNFEMSASDEIVQFAHRLKPDSVCIVPERREEITTEGGLDVIAQQKRLDNLVKGFHDAGIFVSLFIDPEVNQVETAAAVGADAVELHTGAYANAAPGQRAEELKRLAEAGEAAVKNRLAFHAGHGLTVRNLEPVALLLGLREMNIGHSIISRSIFVGLENAVREILDVLHSCSV